MFESCGETSYAARDSYGAIYQKHSFLDWHTLIFWNITSFECNGTNKHTQLSFATRGNFYFLWN